MENFGIWILLTFGIWYVLVALTEGKSVGGALLIGGILSLGIVLAFF